MAGFGDRDDQCQAIGAVLHGDGAVEAAEDVHTLLGTAGKVGSGWQVDDLVLEDDGVVITDNANISYAENLVGRECRWPWFPGWLLIVGRFGEAQVVVAHIAAKRARNIVHGLHLIGARK